MHNVTIIAQGLVITKKLHVTIRKMIERHEHKNVVWLDVVHPTTEEVREIFKECKLPAIFASDLTAMTPRTEFLHEKGAIKITLDFPIVKRTDINHPHEIKFIATNKHLVTIRFEDVHALHKFGQAFEVFSAITGKKIKKISGISLFFSLLSDLYRDLDSKLDYLESKAQSVESDLFNDNDKELLFEISKVSSRLITFRHVLVAHEPALKDLAKNLSIVIPKDMSSATSEVHSLYGHLIRRANALISTVENLRTTNTALLNAKQNEVMKILTIMAFITFPLSLFTSMFGMNTIHTPILGIHGDFWIIVAIMSFITACFFVFFKYKKWM